jgi:hypothetical protein
VGALDSLLDGGRCIPPAAVTSRVPSGETWQLYTSWSRSSPTPSGQPASPSVSQSASCRVSAAGDGRAVCTAVGQPERLDDVHIVLGGGYAGVATTCSSPCAGLEGARWVVETHIHSRCALVRLSQTVAISRGSDPCQPQLQLLAP